MSENEKKINIQYKIIGIRKISHFENDYKEFDLAEKDVVPGNFELKYGINFPGNNNIDFKVNAVFYSTKNKRINLFGIEAVYIFKIRNLEQNFKLEKGYRIPDELMHTIVDMTMSGIRGMLSVLNTIPLYKKIILQPVNTKEICLRLSPQNLSKIKKTKK